VSFSFIDKANIAQAQAQKEVTANEAIEAVAKTSGHLSKAIVDGSGGANVLTADESRFGAITLTGALTATATVTQLAAITKRTIFRNSTTGNQSVLVRIGAGTTFEVPAGGYVMLLSTTDAIVQRVKTAVDISLSLDLVTFTNLAAALTEYNGQTHRRTKFDLTQFTQARVLTQVETAGNAGAEVRVQYSTDESAWSYLDNSAGPASDIQNTGVETDGYVTITQAARTDVFLRAVTIGGDAASDPVIGAIHLQVR
jgi:hypothetical protein